MLGCSLVFFNRVRQTLIRRCALQRWRMAVLRRHPHVVMMVRLLVLAWHLIQGVIAKARREPLYSFSELSVLCQSRVKTATMVGARSSPKRSLDHIDD